MLRLVGVGNSGHLLCTYQDSVTRLLVRPLMQLAFYHRKFWEVARER